MICYTKSALPPFFGDAYEWLDGYLILAGHSARSSGGNRGIASQSAHLVDTNVFIRFEKYGKEIDLSPWEPSERVYISVVTVSELLTEPRPIFLTTLEPAGKSMGAWVDQLLAWSFDHTKELIRAAGPPRFP